MQGLDSTEVASIVAGIGLFLSLFGVTGVDSTVINGFVNGVIGIITFAAALWSWWGHRQKNQTIATVTGKV
jgi:hypothetical protein